MLAFLQSQLPYKVSFLTKLVPAQHLAQTTGTGSARGPTNHHRPNTWPNQLAPAQQSYHPSKVSIPTKLASQKKLALAQHLAQTTGAGPARDPTNQHRPNTWPNQPVPAQKLG